MGGVFYRLFNNDTGLLEQVLALAQVHKAARDNIRTFAQLSCARVYGCDDNKHTLGRKHRPVAYNYFLHLSNGKAVHHPQAVWRIFLKAYDFLPLVLYLYNSSVVGNHYLVLAAPASFGYVGMHAQHVVVAVQRHKESRIYFLMYPKRLVSVGMAGRVYVHLFAVDDTRALPRKIVLQFLHGAFVARHYGRGENDSIALLYFDMLVCFNRDAHERRKLVALGAGSQYKYFVVWNASELFRAYEYVFVHL